MIKFSKPLIAAVQGAASGSLYSAKLDGSDKKALVVAQGNLTGVAYADLVQAKAAARNDGPRLIPWAVLGAQRQRIVRTLNETRGRISGPNGAAQRLGLKRTTLLDRMKKLGIDQRDFKFGTAAITK